MHKSLTLTGKIVCGMGTVALLFIITTLVQLSPKQQEVPSTLLHNSKIRHTFSFTKNGQFIVHKKAWFEGSGLASTPKKTAITFKKENQTVIIYSSTEDNDTAIFDVEIARLPDHWKFIVVDP